MVITTWLSSHSHVPSTLQVSGIEEGTISPLVPPAEYLWLGNAANQWDENAKFLLRFMSIGSMFTFNFSEAYFVICRVFFFERVRNARGKGEFPTSRCVFPSHSNGFSWCKGILMRCNKNLFQMLPNIKLRFGIINAIWYFNLILSPKKKITKDEFRKN